MNRKNKFLLTFSAVMMGGIAFFAVPFISNNIHQYKPEKVNKTEQANEDHDQGIWGAINYYYNLRKNQNTGLIDYAAEAKAAKQVKQLAQESAQYKTASLPTMTWDELGPDDVGGRTRAILIDKNNPNKMFAGGVSGGLWVSNNAGGSWQPYAGDNSLENLTVTCITQAANGDIYYGTGEGLYQQTGTGAGGLIGGGVWKSTDDGATFTRLSSTVPTPNTTNSNWVSVNNIAADPANANRIYAATNRGVEMSDDGGATWANPIFNPNGSQVSGNAKDVEVGSDGTVIAAIGSKGYISSNGDSHTFSAISGLSNGQRTEFAFAPSDVNYVYAAVVASTGKLGGVYQSTDKGQTWKLIGPGGSAQFAPFGSNGQGDYDDALAVFPNDKGHIILGGVDLWAWQQASPTDTAVGSWNMIADQFGGAGDPMYVHADKHTIVFNKTNPNIFYIGCDGGIFRSVDGGNTFSPMNKGYNVTQFYGVAFSCYGANNRGVMGGAQDNGTIYISGLNSDPHYIDNSKAMGGGDGGDCEISAINQNVSFQTVYYGQLTRSAMFPNFGSSFYNARINGLTGLGSPGFASFVTPTALYESADDPNSVDSVMFTPVPMHQNLFTLNGTTTTVDSVLKPTQSSAIITPNSVVFSIGGDTITDDGSGNLVGNNVSSGTINYNTWAYTINFTTAPSYNLLAVDYDVHYNAGAVVTLTSNTAQFQFNATLPVAVNTGDTIKMQDVVQSRLAVGFSPSNGIFMTKKPLYFGGEVPWIKIAGSNSTPDAFSSGMEVQTLAWSSDGDVLYAGTADGKVYRFSNLNAVKDSANGDVDGGASVVVSHEIKVFGGRTVTRIAVDPNNSNRIVVTLGNYSNTAYVYYCADASAATPSFVNKQGNLPHMPVYSAIFEKSNPNTVVIGTEYGVYATDDITTGSVSWTDENDSLPHVPVFMMRQQTLPAWNCNNSGRIYIATHGRGLWSCDAYYTQPTGIAPGAQSASTVNQSGIKVYPNPMNANGNIEFNIGKANDLTIHVYDLSGRLVKSIPLNKLQAGQHKVRFSSSDLPAGAYLLNLDGEGVHATTRFVVVR